MKIYQKTAYEADDGSRWDTLGEATARDEKLAAIAEAMRPLGERPDDAGFANGRGYIRHSPADVLATKRSLLRLLAVEHPGVLPDARCLDPETVDFARNPAGRILDDRGSILRGPWFRIGCIDHQCREWGLPYYAAHPDRGETIDLRGV